MPQRRAVAVQGFGTPARSRPTHHDEYDVKVIAVSDSAAPSLTDGSTSRAIEHKQRTGSVVGPRERNDPGDSI
jgi:glutamate dehydrogenase/leucine dehydrogenase